jgi:hypothetical protein
MRHFGWIVLTTTLAAPAAAQQSASYHLSEHVLNSGGRPLQGATAASASYRVSLDAIGENVNGAGLSSASYWMDGGFTVAYPPPGEVSGLTFPGKQNLLWNPEPSVGDYNLYRGLLGSLSGLGFGTCQEQNLPGETAVDAAVPAAGAGFFYLVTAENKLDEEGTKGFRSGGLERLGNTCP